MLSSLNKRLLLIPILLIGFLVRFFPGLATKVESGIFFRTPDPFYHVRRVEATIANFPYLTNFDYYISYPTGAYCIWPPLYDYLIASLTWLIFLGKPNSQQIEWFCAIYPILYALLLIFFTYLTGKRLFNERIGLLASLFVAILPGTISWSRLGYNDHHIAEALALLLIFYVLISDFQGYKRSILLGLSMAFGILIWQGSILFIGLVFLLTFIFEKELPSIIALLIPLILILPFSIFDRYPGGYFSYRGLSLLHITLLITAIIILLIKLGITKQKKILVAIASLGLVVFLLFLATNPNFRGGINFIIKNNPWHSSIVEFQPLVVQSGYWKPKRAHELLGRAYYLWPIMVLIIFLINRSQSLETIKRNKLYYFITFTIFSGAISFLTLRYVPWFVPFYSLVFAFFINEVYLFFKHNLLRLQQLGVVVILVMLFINFQQIPFKSFFSLKETQIFPSLEQINACRWLRDSTETTSNYLRPTQLPEYGVMCFWDEGHYIVYLSKRPVAASNFGNDVPNFDITNQFYLTESEDSANKVVEKLQCRYIQITKPNQVLYLASKYLGIDPKKYLNLYYTKGESFVGTIMEPNEKALSTTTIRLFTFYGSGFYYNDHYYPPYRHYQLKYASTSCRIFRYVKGTKIIGKGGPGSAVKIMRNVNLPGAIFTYTDSTTANEAGIFSFVVPYPADSVNPYYLIRGKDKHPVLVNEAAILNGDELFLK